MNRSHRKWLTEEIEIDIADSTATPDAYGLTPEGDWTQLHSSMASIQLMGGSEDEDQREQQEMRYLMVIPPPKYAKIANDSRVRFRGREGIVETVAYKYDTKGNLDRLTLTVREVESSGTEEV